MSGAGLGVAVSWMLFLCFPHITSPVPQPSLRSEPTHTPGKLWKPFSNKLPGSHMKANRRTAPQTTTAPFTYLHSQRDRWLIMKGEITEDNNNKTDFFSTGKMMQQSVGRAAVTTSFTFQSHMWDCSGLFAANAAPSGRERHWPSGENTVYHHLKSTRNQNLPFTFSIHAPWMIHKCTIYQIYLFFLADVKIMSSPSSLSRFWSSHTIP